MQFEQLLRVHQGRLTKLDGRVNPWPVFYSQCHSNLQGLASNSGGCQWAGVEVLYGLCSLLSPMVSHHYASLVHSISPPPNSASESRHLYCLAVVVLRVQLLPGSASDWAHPRVCNPAGAGGLLSVTSDPNWPWSENVLEEGWTGFCIRTLQEDLWSSDWESYSRDGVRGGSWTSPVVGGRAGTPGFNSELWIEDTKNPTANLQIHACMHFN
jgi:hypothetical protein